MFLKDKLAKTNNLLMSLYGACFKVLITLPLYDPWLHVVIWKLKNEEDYIAVIKQVTPQIPI